MKTFNANIFHFSTGKCVKIFLGVAVVRNIEIYFGYHLQKNYFWENKCDAKGNIQLYLVTLPSIFSSY